MPELAGLAGYKFYHTIDLGGGVTTPGQPLGPKQKAVLQLIEAADLRGKRVIDLGCCEGLFALAAERRGAREVIAVDNTKAHLDAMRQAILPRLKSKVQPLHRNVLDLDIATYGKFDLVIRELLNDDGMLIVETSVFDDFNGKALPYCHLGEYT